MLLFINQITLRAVIIIGNQGHGGKPYGLKFVNIGTREKPKIKIDIWTDRKPKQETIDSLIKEIRFRYNLDLDLTDFYKSFKNDKVLAPIIKKWHGMRPGHPSSLYEYLIIGILLQLYGVGPATVWYLLFDVFHHWDFFNHISPWEQKIYSKVFFDQDPENPVAVEKLIKYFDRFGKCRQLAVHYIWEDLWWTR